MIASLPMYTFASTANDALWRALQTRLDAAGWTELPVKLASPDDLLPHWQSNDLLLSQTCGYPLATQLRDSVTVVGVFAYSAPGCVGSRYRSWLVSRADDPRTELSEFRASRAAYNGPHSQSGYNSFRAAVAPLAVDRRFFASCLETGAHVSSMRAVANGEADIAAIDCVSFAGLTIADPALGTALRLIGATATAPGLPLITCASISKKRLTALRRALHDLVADPALAGVRQSLMINGFEVLDLAAYDEILAMERAAIAAGYSRLA